MIPAFPPENKNIKYILYEYAKILMSYITLIQKLLLYRNVFLFTTFSCFSTKFEDLST